MVKQESNIAEAIQLSAKELAELRWCYFHLEHPSLAVRLSNMVGTPIEEGLKLLPVNWYERLEAVVDETINRVLVASIESMKAIPARPVNNHLHKITAMGAGAIGGFLGPLTLLAELPFTTLLMLRAISDIAQQQGEDMDSTETRLACAQVFALGGRTKDDQAAEAGYYGLRITLGIHFSHSLINAIDHGHAVIPTGVNIVRAIAARFGVVISDKASAQLIPIAGAVSGAALNLVFMKHFQDIAKGHFTIRRLERKYSSVIVKKAYQKVAREQEKANKSYSTLEGW